MPKVFGSTDPLSLPRIMGILNATPDSFSGDGLITKTDWVSAGLARAEMMVAEGADCLDIGGESTRPGSKAIDVAEELARTLPLIRAVRARFPQIPLSIDTTKLPVAQAALDEGVTIVNSVGAGVLDDALADLVMAYKAQLLIMHNGVVQSDSHDVTAWDGNPQEPNSVERVHASLKERAVRLCDRGLMPYNLYLDVGIGFGKTTAQNLALIRALPDLVALGYPVLLGASRKRFVAHVLHDTRDSARPEGTAAVSVLAAASGVALLRVHDVARTLIAVKMACAVMRGLDEET